MKLNDCVMRQLVDALEQFVQSNTQSRMISMMLFEPSRLSVKRLIARLEL